MHEFPENVVDRHVNFLDHARIVRPDGENVVDGQTSGISKNEFFAINEGGALGLPT